MEKEDNPRKENGLPPTGYDFVVVKPGGNDTALIYGLVGDLRERKRMNDEIMAIYPNVEQVGFIEVDGRETTLMMAGGEFCGNASRSAAYLTLGGEPGEISLNVSGVSKPLRAGVKEDGKAFAEMPIYKDPWKVKPDKKDENSWLVEMEGITHLVIFNGQEKIDGLNKEEIKRLAMEEIKTRNLTEFPAAGVIYTTKTSGQYSIVPIVYVRDIDTLFYETACGSGTTALGLALAKRREGDVKDVSIIQPSGMPIEISVFYENGQFTSAKISGPLEVLVRGSLESGPKGRVVIERVLNQAQLDRTMREGLRELYKEIFSQPPYCEKFTDEDVELIFSEYLERGILFVGRNKESVVGFGAALPLNQVPAIEDMAAEFNLNAKNAWYMADLGVAENYRRFGLGKKLVTARLEAIQTKGGKMVLMRTSANNIASQSLYQGLGFLRVDGMIQEVSQRRVTGETETDKRIFMIKQL